MNPKCSSILSLGFLVDIKWNLTHNPQLYSWTPLPFFPSYLVWFCSHPELQKASSTPDSSRSPPFPEWLCSIPPFTFLYMWSNLFSQLCLSLIFCLCNLVPLLIFHSPESALVKVRDLPCWEILLKEGVTERARSTFSLVSGADGW